MQAVIIAAGESSRFWPLNDNRHKSQTRLMGRSLLYWTIKGLREHGIKDVALVHRPDSTIPAMMKEENDTDVSITYFLQEEPLGSGNALEKARDHIKGDFLLIHPHEISVMDIVPRILKGDMALVGSETDSPQDYGMIRFENERPVEVVENPEKGDEPSSIRTLGMYRLPGDFFEYYDRVSRHEADLIDAINICLKEKDAAWVMNDSPLPTLKYPWHLFDHMDVLFSSVHFEPKVHDTAKICSGVQIKGGVYIGENTVIKENTVIEGPCYIGPNCEIGPFNVIRGPVNIESSVRTGAYMELKHSVVQKGTHFHSGYVGDSIVGNECRIGAGFITANRRLDRSNVCVSIGSDRVDTHLDRFGVVMGDGVHIGIHAGSMPGVMMGKDCKIGPGTTVFGVLYDGSTFYSKQDTKLKDQ